MSTFPTRAAGIAVLAAAIAPAAPAPAQAPLVVGTGIGVGVGQYYGPRVGPWVGPWYGPGLWGWGWGWYPGAAGSFWTNGQTLYGPPVPTFGVTPGAFGGSDAHRNLTSGPPGLYDPWFWPAPRVTGPAKDFPAAVLPPGYNGPRFATRDVKRKFAEQKADPMVGIDRAYRDLERADPWFHGRRPVVLVQPCLRLRVLVPTPDAAVWVQGEATAASGTERVFESPPLTPGVSYTYTVTAKLADGRTAARAATGQAGETVAVDFRPPSAEGRPHIGR